VYVEENVAPVPAEVLVASLETVGEKKAIQENRELPYIQNFAFPVFSAH